jgi:ABC-type branched-subunit amino acid transport system substrate-binding protein
VAQIRGLINDRDIKVMFGPAVGSLALLTAAVTQKPEPPAINISGGGPWELEGLIGKQDTRGLFKTSEGQHTVARLFSRSIRQAYPDAKTVSLLYRNDSTGVAVVKTLEPALAEVGLKIVSNDLFPPDTTDFSSFIARVKSKNPDVFFYGYIPTDDITITKQVVQLGLATDLAVWQGQVSMAVQTAVGKQIPNTFLALYDGVQIENPLLPATADYKKRFSAEYKVDGSSFFSLWQYDYVYMIAKAMQDASTVTDTDAIRDKLLPMRWDGPQGPVCWNDEQNAVTGLDSALVKPDGKVTWYRQPFTVEDCRSQ